MDSYGTHIKNMVTPHTSCCLTENSVRFINSLRIFFLCFWFYLIILLCGAGSGSCEGKYLVGKTGGGGKGGGAGGSTSDGDYQLVQHEVLYSPLNNQYEVRRGSRTS